MAVVPNANERSIEYRFGQFRLNPAAHELRKNGQACPTAPLVFGCLVYLLEHRQRIVGPDEIVSAVWGRLDVADAQVRQLIARVRQLVGDTANEQHTIRTVPGVGYRWVADVGIQTELAEHAEPLVTDSRATETVVSTESSAVTADAPHTADDASSVLLSPARERSRFAMRVAALCATLALGLAAGVWWLRSGTVLNTAETPSPSTVSEGHPIIVLPLTIKGPDEFAWMRLGAMDLIANRLRNADLPVPPTDSVVVALHAAEKPDGTIDIERMRTALGAGLVVNGTAEKSPAGWKIRLTTTTADGLEHRIESEYADATVASRRAAEMLLASLGNAPPREVEQAGELHDRLQQAQAAVLAGEIDIARSILESLPDSMKVDPEVTYRLASIDYATGKIVEATSALKALLENPALTVQPVLRGQALTLLAMTSFRNQDCVATERTVSDAVAVLRNQHQPAELGQALTVRGLANTCMARFDMALDDLGKARAEVEATGDRLGVGRVNSYLGKLELQRNRPGDALNYLEAADAVFQAFGASDNLLRNLTELYYAQTGMLRRADALVTSERLWALRERMKDPASRLYLGVVRADALRTNGRFLEAQALLDQIGVPPDDPLASRALNAARAELAWDRGDPGAALASVNRALAEFKDQPGPDDGSRVALLLLRQRASIAVGKPQRAQFAGENRSSLLLLADAEWAAREGRSDDADRLFREAGDVAQSAGGAPEDVARVAQAYGRWLLARGRTDDAAGQAGRIANWADRDFDSALLQVEAFHALRQGDAWSRALAHARELAGERQVPDPLQKLVAAH